MPLSAGDVIRVWDRAVRPPKDKIHICVSPERQRFLRINSKPLFKPHHLLLAVNCPFLHHDSYVELRQLTRPYAYEIDEADRLGRLPASEVSGLLAAVNRCTTLSEEHKELVRNGLAVLIPPPSAGPPPPGD